MNGGRLSIAQHHSLYACRGMGVCVVKVVEKQDIAQACNNVLLIPRIKKKKKKQQLDVEMMFVIHTYTTPPAAKFLKVILQTANFATETGITDTL